jgi:hypothetical protein
MQSQQSVAVERRSPVAAPGASIVNDIGLLNAGQIPAFRVYLEESGLLVRDSAGSGQFFHVRLPELPRWLAIERGCGGAPVTPDVLRPFVASFLKKPLDSAIGEVRAARQSAERAVARAALALPASVVGAAEPALESVHATVTRKLQAAASESWRQPGHAPVAAPAPLSRYLSDLRDDLALHAPISLPVNPSADDMLHNAIRRWAYADMMLATRTAKAGD